MLIATKNETKEQKIRENDIIVFGIKESDEETIDKRNESDKEAIKEILQKVQIGMEKVIRFNKKEKSKGTSPLLIVVEEKKHRNQIISMTRSLGASDQIYVNGDLTQAQRVEQKHLRADMKAKNAGNTYDKVYYSIRNGRVVKKDKATL